MCCGIRVPAALCLLLLGRLASADDRSAAAALQSEGLRRLEAGDAATALQKFSAAYALVPSPKVLFNMGRAHAELGHPALAYQCFEQFLAEATSVPAESRAEAELMRGELRAKVAFVEVVGPPGAVLSVDGRRRGILPLARPLAFDPGSRAIRVDADGKTVTDKQIDLVAGTTLRLVVEVAPRPVPPPAMVAMPPEPPPRRPLLGRWWFWTAAAAVAVGGAVGLAAALGGFSHAAGCPPERRCM